MEYIIIIISAVLVNNIVLANFLGICPFLGVSKKTSTAVGMGGAVIFVLVLATIVTFLIQHYILNPLNIGYLQTISFILVIAGIALAIWGGYTVYKRTSADNSNKTEVAKENKTILLEDSLSTNPDSITALPVKNISNQTGTTKFVLEVSDKDRATQRYAKLKTFQWDVKMETKDSVSFKLFLLLPINAVDSIKVLDSLTRLNGKQVFIER